LSSTEENKRLRKEVRSLRDQVKALSGEVAELRVHREESRIDALTRIGNRRSFNEALAKAFSGHVRHDHKFGVLLGDMIKLKELNDTYGHPVGDRALQIVAEILESTSRTTDSAHRTGGDEFALVLPECDDQGLEKVEQRIKRLLEQQPVDTDDGPKVIGLRVATLFINGGEVYHSAQQIYEAADAILTNMIKQDGGR